MKIIIPVYITMLFIFCSCKENHTIEKPNNEKMVTISQITTNYDTLIKRVINKGDVDSYDEMYYSFIDANEIQSTDSVMKYSKIMAKNFNNQGAYLDYFKALCRKNNLIIDYSDYSKINLAVLDKDSREDAIKWLNEMLVKKVITPERYNSIKK